MRIGVLGGGQLGRMLALAGHPLGISVTCLDPDPACPAASVTRVLTGELDDRAAVQDLIRGCDAVTFETENVPLAAAAFVEERANLVPGIRSLQATQDRLLEREMLVEAGVPVAAFRTASSAVELGRAMEELNGPTVVKTLTGGYDGKGQARADRPSEALRVWRELGQRPVLVEERIGFDRELSIVAVRSANGESAFYPLVENRHRDGILRLTLAPAPGIDSRLQQAAERHARAVMDALGHVGVLTIEFFEVDGELIANEVAPRVHNSGHWSIEAASCSQFENHLRAITGAPLGSTTPVAASAMVNLIGELPNTASVLAVEGASYHWYGKRPRPDRKLGHVTVTALDQGTLARRLNRLEMVLQVPAAARIS